MIIMSFILMLSLVLCLNYRIQCFHVKYVAYCVFCPSIVNNIKVLPKLLLQHSVFRLIVQIMLTYQTVILVRSVMIHLIIVKHCGLICSSIMRTMISFVIFVLLELRV
uniref:Secreted peptide n=1 Tax=Cacopsylla melanoneura TaxID=428564 RepID=A0A8D9A066_9HEMI